MKIGVLGLRTVKSSIAMLIAQRGEVMVYDPKRER